LQLEDAASHWWRPSWHLRYIDLGPGYFYRNYKFASGEDSVTLTDFKLSLRRNEPPVDSAPALAALWWVKKGDWERAHEIVMNADDADAAWVHAHLHRVEGDRSNAQYWYRQAKKPTATGTFDAEWEAMVAALLAE
jgi:hypothetical protein